MGNGLTKQEAKQAWANALKAEGNFDKYTDASGEGYAIPRRWNYGTFKTGTAGTYASRCTCDDTLTTRKKIINFKAAIQIVKFQQ